MKLKLIKEEGERLQKKKKIRKRWHRLYQFLLFNVTSPPSLSINYPAIDAKFMYFVMGRQGSVYCNCIYMVEEKV